MPARRPAPAPGHCELCRQPVDKSNLISHLDKCLLKQSGDDIQPVRTFLIEVRAMPYWLGLRVRADAPLEELDDFLRGIWLECCGHLSAFTIDGVQYGRGGDEDDEDSLEMEPMDAEIGELLAPRQRFDYDYDFESSTSLELKILTEQQARQSEPVMLMARNDAPEILCQECGKPAACLCSECIWSGEGALCLECAADHDCDEDLLLPVVNSPRCGVCGYTGPIEEDDQAA